MAETTFTNATQVLEPFRGIKKVTIEEYFTSGHRTCQGCESALVMKLMVKAAGPRTIVLGSTGCMYVANTTYYTTPWVVPWMHTQLGAAGSAALGTSAGLKVLMRTRWKKNVPGMLAAGHPEARYIAAACAGYAVDLMNKIRRALEVGGPTFVHTIDPCPKGWDYHPQYSQELGRGLGDDLVPLDAGDLRSGRRRAGAELGCRAFARAKRLLAFEQGYAETLARRAIHEPVAALESAKLLRAGDDGLLDQLDARIDFLGRSFEPGDACMHVAPP